MKNSDTSRMMRVALVSTPRSGNTWLRQMLATALSMGELGAHTPDEVDWDNLPERVVLQLHWRYDPAFAAQLEKHNFRIVVMSRHPLDTLLSILTFSQHDTSTLKWLAGEGGGEQSLEGSSPLHSAFLDYATGPRAAALLSVSAEWKSVPGVCLARYEDLVRDLDSELRRIIQEIAPNRLVDEGPLQNALTRFTPKQMRSRTVDELFHVWQARPGLWKELLPAAAVQRIQTAHAALFAKLGYEFDANPNLEQSRAVENWTKIEIQDHKRILTGLKGRLADQESRTASELQQLKSELRQLADLHLQREQQQQAELAAVRGRLEQFKGLGPRSLRAAQWLQHWSHYFPTLFRSA